ncbi:MAG: DUF4332 domain-containing protein [Lacipirellulaceae bacterium]
MRSAPLRLLGASADATPTGGQLAVRLTTGPCAPTLNAFADPSGAELTGFASLVAHLLLGFDGALNDPPAAPWSPGDADVVWSEQRFRLRRQGSRGDSRLTIAGREGATGPIASGPGVWLAGVAPHAVAPVFVCRGDASPDAGLRGLLSPEVASAVRRITGSPAAPELRDGEGAGLLARRDELAGRIQAMLAERRTESQRLQARLDAVEKERAEAEGALADARRRLHALEGELSADESRVRYVELARAAEEAESRQAADECGPRVEDLDAQVARWRSTLAELDHREVWLRDELARVHPDDVAPELALADQRAAVAVAQRLVADLEAEVARFAGAMGSPLCLCRDAHPRLNPLVDTLGRQLDRLAGLVSQQDRALRSQELIDEAERIDRSRHELRRQLDKLLERRQTLVRTSRARLDKGLAPRDAHGEADRATLEAERGDAAQAVDALQRRCSELAAHADELLATRRSVLSTPELVRWQRELDSLQTRIEATRAGAPPATPRPTLRASDVLARLSDGDLAEVRLVAGGRAVEARERAGAPLRDDELTEEGRRLVAWSLRLALADACAAAGVALPLVFDEPFAGLSDRAAANLATALDDFARRGRQVLLFTRRPAAIERLRSLGANVRGLRGVVAPAPRVEPAPPPRAAAPVPAAAPEPVLAAAAAVVESGTLLCVSDDIDRFPVALEDRRRTFHSARVRTVGDLLGADPSALAEELASPGVTAELVALWQAHVALVCFVPGLTFDDAKSLTDAGVLSIDELAEADAEGLGAKLRRGGPSRVSDERVAEWVELAAEALPRWAGEGWQERWRRNRAERSERIADNARRDRPVTDDAVPLAPRHRDASGRKPPRPASRGDARRRGRAIDARVSKTSGTDEAVKFFLEASSAIVDAPSIGPKRAAGLAKAGVRTVAHLLRADAADLAARLEDSRVDAERVVSWQHQASLVCAVPGLRGHDAIVLVGSGFTSAEEIAGMKPAELLSFIGPFCDSPEGERALRGSPRPDLAEVSQWIASARRRRAVVGA